MYAAQGTESWEACTALQLACSSGTGMSQSEHERHGLEDVVELLLKAGADPDGRPGGAEPGQVKWTPLAWTVWCEGKGSGQPGVMQLLLDYGADPMLAVEQRDGKTETVLDLAVEWDWDGSLVPLVLECPRTDLRGRSAEWLQKAYDFLKISG